MQSLVDIVKHGLVDENQKVKTITSLTIAALAEAAAPYGIESFDDVLEPLWKGIRLLRGKVGHSIMRLYQILPKFHQSTYVLQNLVMHSTFSACSLQIGCCFSGIVILADGMSGS